LPEQNHIYLILLRIACATHNLRIDVGARQRALTYPKLLRADRQMSPTRLATQHVVSTPGSEFFGDHARVNF